MAFDLKLPKKRVVLGPALLWKRILAVVIDFILIDIVIIGPFRTIILTLAGYKKGMGLSMVLSDPSNVHSITILFAFISLFVLVYFTLTEYTLGKTVGKMVMKLRVVSVVSSELPGFWSCLLRSLFVIPIAPFNFLWIIDPVYMMFNKENQRLTEYLGKTKTIQEYKV
jgi:uncharacterized RDD family membrane protein YckC